MSRKVDLSILLPIYNPKAGWEKSIESSLRRLLPLFKDIDLKVYLINDGSSIDLSWGVSYLKSTCDQFEYLTYTHNQGKGFAIRTGMQQAESDLYIYTDWDFPFGEEAVFETYQKLIQDRADLLIGVRSDHYFSSLPLFRKIISKGLRILNFFVLRFNYVDTQAGIKGLSNQARAVFLTNTTRSFIFELEFIRACFRKNLNIDYLSVSHRKDITFSNFGMKTIFREMSVLMRIILT